MKTILTTILLISSLTSMGQFHLRIMCWDDEKDPIYQRYYIQYTDDGWKTIRPIMETFDLDISYSSTHVFYQEKIFMSMYTAKTDAIKFARRFTCYNKCVNFNVSVYRHYQELLYYRKSHPIKQYCCKPIKIK